MEKYVVLDKGRGETPLAALGRFRKEHPECGGVPACYAGRLDPMAEGKLLILLGDECKRQRKYHGLDKEYVIEVLLDVGSDTGDALGLVDYAGKETRIDPRVLVQTLQKEQGAHLRPYPAFSSKTVNGKPLFLYALEGTLASITIPTHTERLYEVALQGQDSISSDTLHTRIIDFLAQVPTTDEPSKALGADFRIKEVKESWNDLFEKATEREFIVLSLRVACGSGTYMRTLSGRIGEALGTKALALSIRRTKIGKRRFGFWVHTYS